MSATAETTLQTSSEDPPQHLQRNFRLGVVSGFGYYVYTVVMSSQLVVTWFLSELTTSNLILSLTGTIEQGSWFFLQFLLSGYVQRKPRTLPLYRQVAVVRVVASALLVLATLALDDHRVLLIVFLLLFTINNVAGGVVALPFLNVVAKTIPPTRRGMYFAWRRFGGGALGLLGGVLVKTVLAPDSGLSFPQSYGVLFTVALLLLIVQVGTFSLVIEPAEAVDRRRVSLAEQLKRARRLPIRDRNFGRFLILRVAIVVSTYASPFYAVYARRVLGAPEDMVGTYVLALTLASVLANLALGRVGDRLGNRLLVRLASFTALLPALAALVIARVPGFGVDVTLIFSLVFLLQGLHVTASVLGNSNYLLEQSSSIERVLYIGLTHGIVGLAWFTLPIGGAIVDRFGFELLFAISGGAGLTAAILSLTLEEPRRRQETAATPDVLINGRG
jgi:MFS family permease